MDVAKFLELFTEATANAISDPDIPLASLSVTVWNDDELHTITGVDLTRYSDNGSWVLELQTKPVGS